MVELWKGIVTDHPAGEVHLNVEERCALARCSGLRLLT
jgi:hypothetical protein